MSANERANLSEENYSYEKYLSSLLHLAEKHNLQVELIGMEASRHTGIMYPIYHIVIHPEKTETICIVAGIHGNEIAGPLSILHILSNILHDLPGHFRYVIYPMINPSGFDLRQRFDDDGRDLNAIYKMTLKSKNYKEVQSFFADSRKFAPFEAVIALHEDSDLDRFYMYGLGKENLQFYRTLCTFAEMWVPAWKNADIYGCQSDDYGLVLATARDHAFDGALYSEGLAKVAYTLETPGKLNIDFRVNMMVQLLLVSTSILNTTRWIISPMGRNKG